MSQMEHIHLVGAAEARHRLYQRIENGLEVDQRAADDLKHFGGRSLLLKRLVTFPRSKVDLAVQLRCRLTCGVVDVFRPLPIPVRRRLLAGPR